MKAIAVQLGVTPAAANDMIEDLFLDLAKEASSGRGTALKRLRSLQGAIAEKEAEGESMSRMLPGGLAEKLRRDGRRPGESERLTVTVLMSDVRGYSAIAERTDPTALATPAPRAPLRDEPRRPRPGRHRDAVHRRRRDGRLRCAVPERGPRRQGRRGRVPDARVPGPAQRGVGHARAFHRSAWASACRPATSRPPCSAPRSASSTRSSATP